MIGWLDAQAGVSGDMLLGALVDAGVPLTVLQQAVDLLRVDAALNVETVTRAGLAATKLTVTVGGLAADDLSSGPRTWAELRELLDRLEEPVRTTAQEVFRRLAEAEAAVHRSTPEQVHLHEVGAVDALADVVGVVAGFHHLGLERLTCSPVSLGSGTARGAHGPLPVPVPAVFALLADVPVQAGPSPYESTTPTGAALLATLVDAWGPLPAMAPQRVGHGAGSKDPTEVPNLLRLVLGLASGGTTTALLLETNVDDLDPRLWPHVLQQLLDAGASDAWLTPILMKKGRPAHTLSVLVPEERAVVVRRVMLTETTTIGLRETRLTKHALRRETTTVEVAGQSIRVKTAWYDGKPVTRTPEWEDVLAAARATGIPAKDVLREAEAQTSLKKPSTP